MTRVRLLGVASFNPHWDAAAKERLDSLLAGQAVVLHLEPTQTRDEQGDLLAYVMREDGTPVSGQIVREGLALADRRVKFAFDAAVDTAEGQARRKHAGLWALADEKEMPRWRSAWFAEKLHQYSQELH